MNSYNKSGVDKAMGKHQVIDNEILFIDDIGTFYDLDSSINDGPIKFGAFGKSGRKHINIEKYIRLGYIEPVLYLISSFGLVVPFKIRDLNRKSGDVSIIVYHRVCKIGYKNHLMDSIYDYRNTYTSSAASYTSAYLFSRVLPSLATIYIKETTNGAVATTCGLTAKIRSLPSVDKYKYGGSRDNVKNSINELVEALLLNEQYKKLHIFEDVCRIIKRQRVIINE